MTLRLFNDLERTDPARARGGEGGYAFLNRVDQPFWERVRVELEQWFSEYPARHQWDLFRRFSKNAANQHLGAWWELYLHHLFRRLGWEVEVHPEIDGVGRHPDFRLTRSDSDAVLVEATLTASGIVDSTRDVHLDHFVVTAINSVKSKSFWVGLKIKASGATAPPRRLIAEPLRRWLDGLDPDYVLGLAPTDYPELPICFNGWDLRIRAIPKPAEARDRSDHQTVAFGPSSGGAVNDVGQLYATLEGKRRRYGRPAEPLVVAVLLASGFFDNESIEQALFGQIAWRYDPDDIASGEWVRQRNGFWINGSRARGTRISAVITGTALFPWSITKSLPRLWKNPYACHPLQTDLALPGAAVSDRGEITYQESEVPAHVVLALPADWPGPEGPFAGVSP